jgi:FkbM family methyltransferase
MPVRHEDLPRMTAPRLKRMIRRTQALFLPADERELFRLRRWPRFTPTTARLGGLTLRIPDAASFVYMFDEIFRRRLYDFAADSERPRVIDAGANIGLGVLFFKRLFPRASVTAVEADPAIFAYLADNVAAAGCHDVELINKAVWTCDTVIPFFSDGADAGRAGHGGPGWTRRDVPTLALADLLDEPVDLLKIDIEGAETDVLEHAADRLPNVKQLFVEHHSFVDQPQTLHRLLDVLHRAGFRVWISPPTDIPQPFIRRPVYLDMDVQLNVFAFRN